MRTWVCAAGLVLVLCGNALAQTSADGSVRGYVKDTQGGVLPGATVTLTSPTAPRPFIGVTDGEGFYRILNLPPGEYKLQAELQGFSRFLQERVLMRAGLSLNIDVALTVGNMSETVEVKGDAPLLDSTSTVQTVNISGDLQRTLPVNTRRHWSDFLGVTPGVTGIQVAGRTADSYMLRGSDFASHVIQVDGADMASAQQNATVYMNLANEAVADIQVKTGAVDAASPIGVGAVINIATKAGTDRLSGAAGFAFQDKSWSCNNLPGGTSSALDQFLPELALGGPVMKGRAWFFGTYRYERVEAGISRTAQQVALLSALEPSFEPYPSLVTGHHYFAKGTGEIGKNHQLQGTYQYDPQESAGGSPIEAEPFVPSTSGGKKNFSARLSSVWSSTLTTRFGVSYNDKALQIFARPDEPSRPVHNSIFLSGGRATGTGTVAILDNGNAGWSFDQPYYKSTISGDLNYYRSGWAGSHEFQTGFYWQPNNHQETIQKFANNGFSREENVLRDPTNPAAGLIPFWREIYDEATAVNSDADHRDIAFYIQDAWRPTGRLTINAGIRVDFLKRQDNVFEVVTQESTEVGPRVGMNYVLTEDHKNVVRASWVRVHDVLSINPASAGSVQAGKRDLYDNNLDGVFETEFVTPANTQLATNRIIDLSRGQPYINEAIAGYKREFPGRVMMDLSYVYREYRNRSALVEVNGEYEGNVFVGYKDERLNDVYQLTSNVWNWHVYNGIELQVTKQTAQVQLLASYTHSWRHIAGTWQPSDPASFIQPDTFDNDKGLGGVRAATSVATDANSLSGTNMTGNNNWIDNVVRLGGVFNLPWEFVVATNYTFQSGPYSGPIVTRLSAPDPQFGPPTVTLSNGRVVSNPLATVIRFANPTRGDGQLRLDALHIWNLRIGRDFRFGPQRLEAAVDIFNVTNEDADQAYRGGGNQLYSPNYGLAQVRQLPRSARLSLRYSF